MAANIENGPGGRQGHQELGAWLGEDGWHVGEGSKGHMWVTRALGSRRGCRKESGAVGKQDACEKQVLRRLSKTKTCCQGRQGEE